VATANGAVNRVRQEVLQADCAASQPALRRTIAAMERLVRLRAERAAGPCSASSDGVAVAVAMDIGVAVAMDIGVAVAMDIGDPQRASWSDTTSRTTLAARRAGHRSASVRPGHATRDRHVGPAAIPLRPLGHRKRGNS
jgi:hypothetical protein